MKVEMKAMHHPVKEGRSWSVLFSSFRVQLLLCLSVGVILPAMLYVPGDLFAAAQNQAAKNTSIAAAIATFVGVLAVRKMGEFPGTITASYIFPALACSYSLVMLLTLLLRAPYSGALLSLSFLLVLGMRFSIDAIERRSDRNFYYLVPGGEIDRIRRDIGVPYQMLQTPALPRETNHAIIVTDLRHDHAPEWERTFAVAALNGIGVYHYKQIWEARTGKVRIEHLSENSLGSLIPSNSYGKMKRAIDITITLVALPLLLIPLAVTALLIRLDSPGPVFFRQERIGFRGRSFRVLKFRTMRVAAPKTDADDQRNAAITKDDDDRITRLGHFLRQTRIDELPQLYNILRGEMSWIGPRPEARPLSEWYESEIPFYSYRHIVRPGITGWAQVNQGHVAGIREVHDKLRYDFYYIKNFSMWIDLVVLFKTVVVVIRGIGAK
ncbi:exopolysaccharide biosynthesis polyprenyl glycosylphosphotransferase [Sphingopyxis terrae]|uniref:exopolysaccharide biosynthesis polyprenyl glycosylphosphotransferase n=1 Tax=Sphingopyxis terrae TaxID=33052 RepID=UPI002A1288D0|nr:exopolysaccharide biosynthesis polyprenyl glycosylphosphotransferase [Sphingopyxis terrae]MDX8357921.1 exopolysaccharide biosynthesis polyprenyl glycosylphosphotransferase [Sphingopyxis terrae]